LVVEFDLQESLGNNPVVGAGSFTQT
jgi:hypothetical protein